MLAMAARGTALSLLLLLLVVVVAAAAVAKEGAKEGAAPAKEGAKEGPAKEGKDGAAAERPDYIECVDSAECAPGECCVLGGNRYSIPSCRAAQPVDGACRARGQKPYNTTVGYPDGSQVRLTNVYWLFCPCAEGLACQRESSSCQRADN